MTPKHALLVSGIATLWRATVFLLVIFCCLLVVPFSLLLVLFFELSTLSFLLVLFYELSTLQVVVLTDLHRK